MMIRKIFFLMMMLLFLFTRLQPLPAEANVLKQSEPFLLCAQGMQTLLLVNDPEPALLLLEEAFEGREQVTAAGQEMFNMCVLWLALLRYMTNDLSGALEAFDYALQAFRASGEQELEWSILYGKSAVYTAQGDYPKALDLLSQALSLSQQADESLGSQAMPLFYEAATLNNIGYVLALQGRYQEAQEKFEAAEDALDRYDLQVQESGGVEGVAGEMLTPDPDQILADLEELLSQFDGSGEEQELQQLFLGDVLAEGGQTVKVALLNNRAEMSRLQGRYDEAMASFNQALALLRQEGSQSASGVALPSVLTTRSVNEALVLNNIALVYADQLRYAEALQYFQQARASMQASENLVGEVLVLNNIGGLYAVQAEYESALQIFSEALALGASDAAAQASVYMSLGAVHYARADYEQALDSFQQASAQMAQAGNQLGQAQALGHVADVYVAWGRYEEALKELEQALLIMRQKGLLSGEGLILNSIGAVYQAQGRHEEALEYFAQALNLWRALGDKKNQAATLNNTGAVYREQGAHEQALSTLEEALRLGREVNDRDTEAVTLNNIGTVYHNLGRYREAETNFGQAFDIYAEIGNQAGQAQTLNNLGGTYQATGGYKDALKKYQEALALQRDANAGNRPGEAETLNNIGAAYLAQGRYGEALDVLQQVQGIWEQIGARQKNGLLLVNIASVYQAQGRDEEALEEFKKALKILREVNHPTGEATTLNNMGAILSSQRQLEQALEKYEEALELQRQIGDRAGEALSLSNMGLVYFYQNEQTKGLTLLQESLSIRRQIGNRAGEGIALANIAAVYLAQGASSEALTHYQEALVIMQEAGAQVNEGVILSNIGFLYEEQDQHDEALAYYERAMSVYESVRAVAGSDLARISLVTQYVGLYEHAVGLYYAQGQDEKAFLTSERGRARAFFDSLATGEVQLSNEAATDLFAQERALYTERQVTRSALAHARAFSPSSVTTLSQELKEIESQYASVLAQIEQLDQNLSALIPGRTEPVSLAEIQNHIAPNTTLVSYYILGNDETLAFVITPDDLKVVALGVCCEELKQQITGFYEDFSNPFLNDVDAHKSKELPQLYQWLITPLKPHLNTPSVTIVPHNILHYLPFAALTDGETYLADDYVLSTLPSASVLPLIQENRPPNTAIESVLALGNPTGDLEFSEQEVAAIADLFGAEPLVGADATKSALKQAGQANILHIAAHGSYNSDQPLDSKLILAGDSTNDGLLDVGEVYGLQLTDTNLVVLSACETGLQSGIKGGESVVIAGDEIVALNRAFLFAGTPTVVSTLWGVDDNATALLMEHFYTHLQAGMGKAEALRQAQIELQEQNPDYAHPYYWAGFVLTGDAGEVKGTFLADRPWLLPGGGGLILLVLGAGWWMSKRRKPKRRAETFPKWHEEE